MPTQNLGKIDKGRERRKREEEEKGRQRLNFWIEEEDGERI